MENKLFTIYDKDTGAIIRTGSVPEDELQDQLHADNECILCDVALDPNTQTVDVDTQEVVLVDLNARNLARRGVATFNREDFTPTDPATDLKNRVIALEDRVTTLEAQIRQLTAKV